MIHQHLTTATPSSLANRILTNIADIDNNNDIVIKVLATLTYMNLCFQLADRCHIIIMDLKCTMHEYKMSRGGRGGVGASK